MQLEAARRKFAADANLGKSLDHVDRGVSGHRIVPLRWLLLSPVCAQPPDQPTGACKVRIAHV